MGIRKYPCFMFFGFFICCFFFTSILSHGADTISANQSLSGNQTITSAGGNFELGFYKPGNSSYYYISMWYAKVSTLTIVWVANRDNPISDKYSSVLKILDGNLVLLNESQRLIWSTNQNSTTSNSVVAVLGDDGNLILRDGSNSSQPIWQSFDHPAHTWLPGAKIAYNKLTNTHQRLTSWKNSEDPSTGLYSLNLDANNSQYVIFWNGSKQYWSSGPWNGQFFSSVPEMRTHYVFNFSYLDNENESYFTYSLYDPSIIFRFIMDISGQVQELTWLESTKQWNFFWAQPRQQCEVYDFCGQYGICNNIIQPFCNCLTGFNPKSLNDWNLSDFSGGCVRRTELQCGNSTAANQEKDRFWEISNSKLPEFPQFVAVGSAADCESSCLNNCSCTAYSYDSNECSIWIGKLMNMQDGGGNTLYLRLASSEFPKPKSKKGIIIGAVVGSIALEVVLVLVCVVLLKRQNRIVATSCLLWRNTSRWLSFLHEERMATVYGSLVAFRYKDLQKATKNFSEKIGEGGFGSVFKGTLPDSTIIAVKKLKSINQEEKQFQVEVSTLGTIQHVNLVRLCGFCSEGKRKLLVYDYMQSGSLDSHLFHEKESKVLDWQKRYQIALGTARGLAYLHENCRDCIIHCDIKPANILLDVDFRPKVADFGLAKLLGREFSRVLTAMRGTTGYLAPEWILGVAITTKADVYSYGMMLFELISGRRNTDQSEERIVKFFPVWAASVVINGGDVLSLLDHRLEKHVDVEEVWRICKVACWCIQDDENDRPSMGQVVQILEGILDVEPSPIPRLLQALVAD
ncbi:unnamed protein product [Camellia sinensis]